MSQFVRIFDRIINLDRVTFVEPEFLLNAEVGAREVDRIRLWFDADDFLSISRTAFLKPQDGVLSNDCGFEFYNMCCHLFKFTQTLGGKIIEPVFEIDSNESVKT